MKINDSGHTFCRLTRAYRYACLIENIGNETNDLADDIYSAR